MRIVLVAVTLALAGCATPYQPMGFSGGYRDRRMSEDSFFIEVRVNGYTSSGTANEYLNRRAQELCLKAGYDRYALTAGTASAQVGAYTNASTGQTTIVQKPEMSAVAQCYRSARRRVARPPAASPGPARSAPSAAAGGVTWYCATATDTANLGACRVSAASCEELRAGMEQQGVKLGPCAATPEVTCYEYDHQGNGIRSCHPTAATCAANRDAVAQQAGSRVRSECAADQ